MTSRHAELEAAVRATKVVPFAVGIELTDLTLDDSVNYLLHATNTTAPTRPLRRHGHHHPDRVAVRPERVALSPRHTGRRQSRRRADHPPDGHTRPHRLRIRPRSVKLLDIEQFSTRGALEDHLLDNFIPTAYDRFLSNRPAAKRRPGAPNAPATGSATSPHT